MFHQVFIVFHLKETTKTVLMIAVFGKHRNLILINNKECSLW